MLAAGDRIYMVVYVGAKGQENSADLILFPEFVQADQLTATGFGSSEIRLLHLPSERTDARTEREHAGMNPWLPILRVDKYLSDSAAAMA